MWPDERIRARRFDGRVVVVAAVAVAAALGCGSSGDNGGSGQGGGPGGPVNVDFEPPDRSHISYVANLLAKVDAGDWTLGEGLVATLRVFVGEEDVSNVLLQPELVSYEGTGIFDMANDYLGNGTDSAAQAEIERLLGLLIFSAEELEQMAGLTAKSNTSTSSNRAAKGAATQNCQDFFDKVPIGVSVCLEEESEMIGDDRFRIFLPADSLPSGGWTQQHVSLTQQAIRDSVPVYEALGEMPSTDIIFSVANGGRVRGAASPQDSYCAVVLFASIQGNTPGQFQQLVAHELAHCFQVATVPEVHTVPYPVTKWQEEGLAEYWSNEVYQFEDFEWRWINDFRQQELQNTLFDRSYENFIFFQYLGNVIGNDGILAVLRSMPTDELSGKAEQEAALGSNPGMDDTFHEFTKAVTDIQVIDSGGHQAIPVQPLATSIEIIAAATPLANATRIPPFGTSRLLVGVSEDRRQAHLNLEPSTLTIDSSRPASGPVMSVFGSFVTESIGGGGRPWSRGVPSRLPEEECDTVWRMLVTTTAEPDGGFDLDVPEVDQFDTCCLHGTWLMNNQDLADADSDPGVVASYSGELTAAYRADGTVLFLWEDFMRTFVDNASAGGPFTSTDVVEGGGSQFYSTRFDGILLYEGPEITPTVTDGSDSFIARLDTGLGDLQASQFFVCEGDSLFTTIRGDVDIGWTRTR